jgi:cytochrome P450
MIKSHYLTFLKKSLSWRRMRKAANDGFSKSSVKRFHEKQTTEAIILACDCLVTPAQWDNHLRRAAASTIMSVVYGYPPIPPEGDHIVNAVNDLADRNARAAFPGTYWVEFFPWMRYIPSR